MKTINFFVAAFLLCLTTFASPSTQAETCKLNLIEFLESCPTANFSIGNNNVPAGTSVGFINRSTGATSYLWDFGDGNTSTAVSPSHVYEGVGTYTVKLLAITEGCTVEFIGTEDVTVI